jgi:hypothetical protein
VRRICLIFGFAVFAGCSAVLVVLCFRHWYQWGHAVMREKAHERLISLLEIGLVVSGYVLCTTFLVPRRSAQPGKVWSAPVPILRRAPLAAMRRALRAGLLAVGVMSGLAVLVGLLGDVLEGELGWLGKIGAIGTERWEVARESIENALRHYQLLGLCCLSVMSLVLLRRMARRAGASRRGEEVRPAAKEFNPSREFGGKRFYHGRIGLLVCLALLAGQCALAVLIEVPEFFGETARVSWMLASFPWVSTVLDRAFEAALCGLCVGLLRRGRRRKRIADSR